MNTTFLSVVASTCLLASSTLTHANCNSAFSDNFAGDERIVDSSLHGVTDLLNARRERRWSKPGAW
jgi:hypothetical protein